MHIEMHWKRLKISCLPSVNQHHRTELTVGKAAVKRGKSLISSYLHKLHLDVKSGKRLLSIVSIH